MLDPEVTYLNHGSFGAVPRPVFEAQNELRRELELEPVLFLARKLPARLARVRQSVARYVGAASGDDIGLVPNVTTGLNAVARSIELRRGDEILADRPRVRRQADPVGRGRGPRGREDRRRPAAAAGAQRGRSVRCGRDAVHAAHACPVREPHHVAERPRPSGRPAERARPRARSALDRRRRARPRPGRPRPPVDRMRHLRRQPAQVGVRAARQRVRVGDTRGAELDSRPGRLLGLVVVRAGRVPGPVRLGRDDRSDRPPLRPRRLPIPARAFVAAGAAALRASGPRHDGRARDRGGRCPARRRRAQGTTDGRVLDPVPPIPTMCGDTCGSATASRSPARRSTTSRCSGSRCRRTRARRTASASSRRCGRRSVATPNAS